MKPVKLDVMTKAPDGYFEYSAMRGVEMKTIENEICLWQEIVGELKTNRGEVLGVGMQNYGSELKEMIGENMDIQLEREIENEVKSIAESYEDVLFATANVVGDENGIISIELELRTKYGIVLEIFNITRGC
jgi:phage baseplate assembly protein W